MRPSHRSARFVRCRGGSVCECRRAASNFSRVAAGKAFGSRHPEDSSRRHPALRDFCRQSRLYTRSERASAAAAIFHRVRDGRACVPARRSATRPRWLGRNVLRSLFRPVRGSVFQPNVGLVHFRPRRGGKRAVRRWEGAFQKRKPHWQPAEAQGEDTHRSSGGCRVVLPRTSGHPPEDQLGPPEDRRGPPEDRTASSRGPNWSSRGPSCSSRG